MHAPALATKQPAADTVAAHVRNDASAPTSGSEGEPAAHVKLVGARGAPLTPVMVLLHVPPTLQLPSAVPMVPFDVHAPPLAPTLKM